MVLNDAKLVSWEVRARLAAMRSMFKYKLDSVKLESAACNTGLQAGSMLKIDAPKSIKFINSISYSFRNEWNSLPAHIRHVEDFEFFKTSIKNSTTKPHSLNYSSIFD